MKAMPCTSVGGVSQAVQVPPSACHCRTMLCRRKSITEIVALLSEAMPEACRIHGCLNILAVKNLRGGGAAGRLGECALHGARGQNLRQNLGFRRAGCRIVHDVQ